MPAAAPCQQVRNGPAAAYTGEAVTKTPPTLTVDDYLAAQPLPVRKILERVRTTIRKALPKNAVELISYRIPAYRLPEGIVLYFAGWKQHYSIYPVTAAITAAFPEEVATYQVSKGTLRFPLDQPVPVKLIAGIAKIRAQETIARKATKEKKPRK